MRLATIALVLVTVAACKTHSSSPAPSPAPAPSAPSAPPAPSPPSPPSPPSSVADPLSPLTCANIQHCVEKCPLGAALPPCAAACVARLTAAARPYYDALQACVAPACAVPDGGPCLDPGSLGCKLCAMSHCASLASTCLLH